MDTTCKLEKKSMGSFWLMIFPYGKNRRWKLYQTLLVRTQANLCPNVLSLSNVPQVFIFIFIMIFLTGLQLRQTRCAFSANCQCNVAVFSDPFMKTKLKLLLSCKTNKQTNNIFLNLTSLRVKYWFGAKSYTWKIHCNLKKRQMLIEWIISWAIDMEMRKCHFLREIKILELWRFNRAKHFVRA